MVAALTSALEVQHRITTDIKVKVNLERAMKAQRGSGE
jgi:hypothetical protein